MTPYAAKARLNTRKAWLALGKAKEARNSATLTDSAFLRDIMLGYSRDMAKIARSFMSTAILYRQLEGRL